MKPKIPRPNISITTRSQASSGAGGGTRGMLPHLLFPAWKTPRISCENVESYETSKTSCWEYKYSWENTLAAYDKIKDMLRCEVIAGIVPSPGASEFWEVIRNAQQHVYIYDNHFEPEDFCRILCVLNMRARQNDSRRIELLLMTNLKRRLEDFKKLYDSVMSDNTLTVSKMNIYLLSTDGDDRVHDRFALVDGDIWHFGAKVGAMHRSVNAFSGPWDDNGCAMRFFFRDMVYIHEKNQYIGSRFVPDCDGLGETEASRLMFNCDDQTCAPNSKSCEANLR